MIHTSKSSYWRGVRQKAAATVLLSLVNLAAEYLTTYLSRHHVLPRPASSSIFKTRKPGNYEELRTLDDGTLQMLDSSALTEPFSIRLPDGTRVRLCYGSSLRYAPSFNGNTREVFVNGQADFDVAQKSDQPFIVHTVRTTIQVLGTHFNVMDYADEPFAEITLLRGKVRVIHSKGASLLKPSEQAIVEPDRMQVRRLSHPEGTIGWANEDSYLEFDNAEFDVALRRLARCYQVKIENPDKLKGIHVSGSFWLENSLATNLHRLERLESGAVCLNFKDDTILVTGPNVHR